MKFGFPHILILTEREDRISKADNFKRRITVPIKIISKKKNQKNMTIIQEVITDHQDLFAYFTVILHNLKFHTIKILICRPANLTHVFSKLKWWNVI